MLFIKDYKSEHMFAIFLCVFFFLVFCASAGHNLHMNKMLFDSSLFLISYYMLPANLSHRCRIHFPIAKLKRSRKHSNAPSFITR